MSQMILYLKLEPYLAQWFIHNTGGVQPVHLKRGSSESDILEHFLTAASMDSREGEVAPEDANVAIALPTFKTKDPRYYNYLPPRARAALMQNIYVRFRIEMWKDLHVLEGLECPVSERIWGWMEAHGIDDDPKAWETIRQMYYRKRKAHCKKMLKSQENTTTSEDGSTN